MSGKKIIALALAIVIVTCIFSACKKQTHDTEISTTSSTVAETTESVTEESTTVENSTEENTSEEKSSQTQTTKKAESTTKASGSTPSTTQKSKEHETTKAPCTTKAPPQTTKAPETTTQKPTTTQQTTVKAIDIDYYINYAINYGKSIGLTYLNDARDCWDTPIIIASDNHDSAIRDIKRRLERYKNVDGDEYFCVWAEKRSDDKYELFIGYA